MNTSEFKVQNVYEHIISDTLLIKPDYITLKVKFIEDLYYRKLGLNETNVVKEDEFTNYLNNNKNIIVLETKKINISNTHFIEKQLKFDISKHFVEFVENFRGKILYYVVKPVFNNEEHTEILLLQLKESSQNYVLKKFKDVKFISSEEIIIRNNMNDEPKTFHESLKENFIVDTFTFNDEGVVDFKTAYKST